MFWVDVMVFVVVEFVLLLLVEFVRVPQELHIDAW